MELLARSLDLTHPYFVSIKDLVFPRGPKIIINPAEDELMKAFGKSRHLMFPFQSVQLIEELAEEDPPAVKIRPFSVIDASEKFTARGNKDGDG